MERVMVELAISISLKPEWSVDLVVLTSGKSYYEVPSSVNLIKPAFSFSNSLRIVSMIRTVRFLRQYFRKNRPFSVLSFGGKYNSFVLLASLGYQLRVFVSDRSRPGISYGWLQDILNPLLYKKATGIIAQTKIAKEHLFKTTRHPNIRVIGNPITRTIENSDAQREKIVLNVGRFIKSKQQQQLVNIFDQISEVVDWKLIFIGDGPEFDKVYSHAKQKKCADRIQFIKHMPDIKKYYQRASIFAFTSVSEGFPNVLGEAMANGLACIAYNCCAGPADLITHEQDGYLIPENDQEAFLNTLRKMMVSVESHKRIGENAMSSVQRFDKDLISQKFLDFIAQV